jgi:hypothetical protein
MSHTKSQKSKKFDENRFSLLQIIIFALAFAAIGGSIFLTSYGVSSTVPLNSFVNSSKPSHLYSQQATTSQSGYTKGFIAGFIETEGTSDRALYRLSKSGFNTYTDSVSERSLLISQGYTSNEIIGYTLPPGTTNTLPTFRLEKSGDVILTGDYVEKADKIAAGWTLTATLGNLTQRRCLPYAAGNNTPPLAVGGRLFADWEAADPFAVFRAIESVNPCEPERGIQVVTAPRRQGNFAARHKINPDDVVNGLKGNRSLWKISSGQMIGDPTATSMEGLERWFGSSLLLPNEYFVNNDDQFYSTSLIEWHNGPQSPESPCQVPILLFVKTAPQSGGPAVLRFNVRGGHGISGAGTGTGTGCTSYEHTENVDFITVDEVRNHWQDFVFHMKFCFDDNCEVNGLTELWRNGELVASFKGANMYKDEKLTAFQGNYRGVIKPESSELYHDGWNMGNSYEEVMPSNITPPPVSKIGDVNTDNKVDLTDLSIVLTNFNKTKVQSSNPACDINNDNLINIFDLSILLSNYGS